ncbi:hypothetical protein FFLO_02146 [Filobasidium floriforme]|uniref:Beta-glucosidase n=1 Tax=Filobasidium floriforme TaxID=5210 RepID=A0A8K0NRJ7_9TREE|nr:hypothetical protein FFLO_02146 [Filobasidium floriforme]
MAQTQSAEWQPPAGLLPKTFLHGYATASYQVEGAHDKDGRGPSVWDDMCRVPGQIADGSSGDDACNSYYMTDVDVPLLKSLGVNAYRFSISWSRLIPQGGKDDPINPAGIAYYNKLIDALLAHGITPFVTLFHWDLPSGLEKRYRGWTSRNVLDDFQNYVRLCFKEFGDRVKNWITLNEPICVVMFSSLGLKPDWDHEKDFYPIAHHLILAHAQTVDIYRREFKPEQKGIIGITLNCDWCEPIDDSPAAKQAAQRRMDQSLGWVSVFTHLGHYPKSIEDKAPKFTEDEWKLIKGSSEFFGLNSYSTLYTNGESDPDDHLGGNTRAVRKKDGVHIGNEGHLEWLCDVPWGFGKLLAYINEKYMLPNDIPLIVTEQGFAVKNEHLKPLPELLKDTERIDYYRGYLKALTEAISKGMRCDGYMAWSFIDNFEWKEGYIPAFGAVHVDRKNGEWTRTPKDSTKWLKSFWDRVVEA